MKRIIFLVLMYLAFDSFGQNLTIEQSGYTFEPSLNQEDSTENIKSLVVNLRISDSDLLGLVIIDLVENSTQYPMVRLKKTTQELFALGQLINNQLTIPLGDFSGNTGYTIKVLLKNYTLLDLPQLDIIVPLEN